MKWKSLKRGLAVILSALLITSSVSVYADETSQTPPVRTEVSHDKTSGNSEGTTEETTESTEEGTTEEITESTEEGTTEETTESTEEGTTEETTESTEEGTTEETTESTEEGTTEIVTETETETESETGEAELIAFSDIEDVVAFNTGSMEINVIPGDVYSDDLFEACLDENILIQPFEEDGSFTIEAEADAFFPYEVQFRYGGRTESRWFLNPDDRTSVNGHTFGIHSEFSGDAVTQMSLRVGSKIVTVYPEEKEFTNDGGISTYSLMPLEEKSLRVDLSEFAPIELTMISMARVFQGTRELTETDKVTWVYQSDGDDFTISAAGDKLDFSHDTYYGGSTQWQMIVGSDDQLDQSNIRYNVTVRSKSSRNWLVPSLYSQDSSGARKAIQVRSYGYDDDWSDRTYRRLSIAASGEDMGDAKEAYLSLAFNPDVFGNEKFAGVRVYEGRFLTAEETQQSGNEITDLILNADMMQRDTGYLVKIPADSSERPTITMVVYDENQKAIGCLPVELYLYKTSTYISDGYLLQTTAGGGWRDVERSSSFRVVDGVKMYTKTLYRGYAADGRYRQRLTYYKDGQQSNSEVTAAYVGKYDSIAEAQAAGAEEVKASLFNSNYSTGGYEADFSNGVTFSIFIGEDGAEKQDKYYYNFKTVADTSESGEPDLHVLEPIVYFNGLKDADSNAIAVYSTKYNMDSYSEYEFLTMIVEPGVDLTNVAPEFYFGSRYETAGVKLYAPGSSTPEVSGESFHDFSKGAVQYTVATQSMIDGKDYSKSRNYWLQIIKADSDAGKLYVNSLADPDSKTWTDENGVIHSRREVHIDGYQGDSHDILLINMGTGALKGLSAELSSGVLELDDYWNLKGQFELSGYSTINKDYSSAPNGELPNMAKLRLRAQDGKESDSDDLGTLTIQSDGKPIMIFELTGSVGDPHIITQDVPQAVKYVPYGTMIQNSNKYSWNTVTYRQTGGSLPTGMQILQSGELYGVPKEAGMFTFDVTMYNSSSRFGSDTKTFTLEVLENTDVNVDNATDDGYTLSTRLSRAGAQYLIVSEGVFPNFKYIYLDGDRLVEGVDYDAESGSTRITIRSETLSKKGAGVHTIGIEFREGGEDTGELKRAAQNYDAEEIGVVQKPSNSSNSSSSSSDSSSSNSSSNNAAVRSTRSDNVPVEVIPVEGFAFREGYTMSQADLSRENVLRARLLNQYYGQRMYLNAVFSANFGLTIDMAGVPLMSNDVEIAYTLSSEPLVTSHFNVIHAIPNAVKPLGFSAIFNFHVGTEYIGKTAYIYQLNETRTGYDLAGTTIVNEIGNIAFISENINDVIIFIEK